MFSRISSNVARSYLPRCASSGRESRWAGGQQLDRPGGEHWRWTFGQVVDLWGSSVDPKYTGDSLQTIWSSTKNLTSLALAMLVDQGLLAYSDRWWPGLSPLPGQGVQALA